MEVIIDSNVLTVANQPPIQASPKCVLNCVKKLRDVEQHHTLVLDQNGLILKEYTAQASTTGQPGVGHAFWKWVLTNQYNEQRCHRVSITPTGDSFVEFPNAQDLQNFDISDRKFVAVALTHPAKPPICNAVDSDWRNFHQPLQAVGVTVEFLCSEYAP